MDYILTKLLPDVTNYRVNICVSAKTTKQDMIGSPPTELKNKIICNHTWEEEVVSLPTTDSYGVIKRTCIYCGASTTYEFEFNALSAPTLLVVNMNETEQDVLTQTSASFWLQQVDDANVKGYYFSDYLESENIYLRDDSGAIRKDENGDDIILDTVYTYFIPQETDKSKLTYTADGKAWQLVHARGDKVYRAAAIHTSDTTTEYSGTYDISSCELNSGWSKEVTTWDCFPEGTQVLMYDGSIKTIESVEVGDSIQGYNIKTSEYCEAKVAEIVTGYTTRMAQVLCESGLVIIMAEGHPLYTVTGRKSLTGKDNLPILTVGDQIWTAEGYTAIEQIAVHDCEPTLVYSLVFTSGAEEHTDDIICFIGANGVAAISDSHGGGSN